MSNRENEKYDRLMKDLYEQMEVPDSTPSWNALQSKLHQRNRRKKSVLRIKIISGVVCASLAISLMLSGVNVPQQAQAMVSDFFNGMRQIFLKKPTYNPKDALTIPPPEIEVQYNGDGSVRETMPEEVTVEEAKQKLEFPLLLPSYVPEHLELNVIQIHPSSNGQFHHIYFEYLDDNGYIARVTQRMIGDNSSIMYEVHDENASIREITIGENHGVIMEVDGTVYVEWIASNVKMGLSGRLSEYEALEWAKSFRP